MTIKETINSIVQQKNFMDNEELEKELGFLVWETKRIMINEARTMLKIWNECRKDNFPIDKFLVKLDGAVK